MKFTKMQACGNDYIYVDLHQETIENPSQLSRLLSPRHFAVGGDGLITIGPSERADFAMRIYNADGSEAEMCGNGIRCVAKYVYDHGLTKKRKISVETGAGIKTLSLGCEEAASGREIVTSVRVDMGEPILSPGEIPVLLPGMQAIAVPFEAEGKTWRMSCISMGNPHAVFFVPSLEDIDIKKTGPAIENHPLFPKRTNVEFVEVVSHNELRMQVWERGSGETMACGTGACASVVAAVLNGHTKEEVLVHLSGGDLFIQYDRESNHVLLTGPAVTVYQGELDEEAWKRGEQCNY